MRFVYWLLGGLIIYVLYGYKHSRLRRDVAPVPVRDFNPESQLPKSDIKDDRD